MGARIAAFWDRTFQNGARPRKASRRIQVSRHQGPADDQATNQNPLDFMQCCLVNCSEGEIGRAEKRVGGDLLGLI